MTENTIKVNNVQPKQSYGDSFRCTPCSKLTSMFSNIFIQKLHAGGVVKPFSRNAVIAPGFRGI